MSAMTWFSRNKPLRYAVAILGLAAGLVVLSQYTDRLPINDFMGYWSAAKLNLSRQDPFNFDQVLALQQASGLNSDYPTFVWNPPWVMSLITPLGWLARPLAQMLWLLLNTGAVLISVDKAWQIYGGNPKLRWVAMLVGFTFIPAFFALTWRGQISPLLLPGVVGFLIYHQQPKKGWLAGAFAALATVKPQVPYLFFIVLLLWCLSRRRWDILAGFAAAIATATLIALAINPPIFQYYINALSNTPPVGWATPTIGTYLRLWLSPHSFWLQFVPPALGAACFLLYWCNRRQTWDWLNQTPILLLVSFITSAYTWTYDQVLLSLAALQIFAWATNTRRIGLILTVSVTYLAMHYVYLRLHLRLDDMWFIWFAPLQLLWYLAVRWLHNKTVPHETV